MKVPCKPLLAAVLAAICLCAAASADEAQDQFAVAAGHFERQRWDLAADEFRTFLEKHGEHPLAGNATYFLGMAHLHRRQYEEARAQFRACASRRPEGRKAIEAEFRLGEMSYLLEDAKSAQAELNAFRKDHPDDSLNAFVLPYLADLALKSKQAVDAAALYREALKRFPTGPRQDSCRLGLAMALEAQGQREEPAVLYAALAAKTSSPLADQAQHYLGKRQFADGDFAAAARTFAELEEKFSASRYGQEARLWQGCALYRQKQYTQARRLFGSLQEHPKLGVDAQYWLGVTFKAQGEWQRAADALLETAKQNPRHARTAEMHFQAGDAYRMAGKHEEARQQFDHVLAHWPEHTLADQSLLGKLRIAAEANDDAQLEALARRLETEFPGKPSQQEAQRRLGRSLIARGNYQAAADVLEPLLSETRSPTHRWETQHLLAEAYFQRKDHAKALATLAPVLERSAPAELRAEAVLTKARILAAQEQWGEVVTALESFLAEQPSPERAARGRAELMVGYVKNGQFDTALKVHADLAARHGNELLFTEGTLRLAEALFEAKQFQRAAELYAALANEPKHAKLAAEGLSGLGWSQLQSGLLPAAAESFAKLLAKWPDHALAAEAALARGQTLEQLGEKAQAAQAYQQVIERYGQGDRLATALLGGAQVQAQLGQHAKAAEMYQRLLKDFPQHPQKDVALYQLAWAYQDQQMGDEALDTFQQLHREHRSSRFWVDATYRTANAAFTAGRRGEAETLVKELLAAEPKGEMLAHALFLQGRLAATKEDWAGAVAPMERVMREFPNSSLRLPAEYWRAEAVFQQGKFEEALRLFSELAPRVQTRDEKWVGMVPLRQAQALVHLQKWPEAQKIAEGISAKHPQFEAQYEVDYLLGRCLANQAAFEEARAAYKRVTQSPRGGKTETAAMAQWMIGEAHFHQKNYRTALNEYLRVEILYDYPKWQAAALLQAGKCCEHLGYWKLAVESYERILAKFAQTEFKDDAAKRLEAARKRRREVSK